MNNSYDWKGGFVSDHIDNLKNKSDPFAKFLDVQINQLAEGYAKIQMQIAENHYLTGLAYEGLGQNKKARKEFANALKLNPGHVWSKVHLESL